MNPQQRKQVIIMAVLGVVLVGVVVHQLMGKGASKEGSSETKTPAKTPRERATSPGKPEKVEIKKADVDLEPLLASVEVLDFSYDDHRIPRDPMKSLVGPAMVMSANWPQRGSEGAELIQNEIYINAIREKMVSGIIWDEENPCAVVDNEIAFKGTQFPLGITVVDIGKDYVLFRGGSVQLPVGLKE